MLSRTVLDKRRLLVMVTSNKGEQSFSLLKVLPAVFTVSVGMLLTMMDTTIMNVAMPTLQHHFGTSLTTIQWTITAYTLALAAVTPLSGWLSDRLTSKWAFGCAIVVFTIFSLACSLSTSVGMLITFRALQGLAGGIVGPVGMALSWQLIPQDKRGSLMGILGLPLVIAPIAGPILSGWLLQHASWHAIFLINFPVGILALILVVLFIPKIKTEQKDRLDWVGLLLAPAGFLNLLYGIHELGNHAITKLTTGVSIIRWNDYWRTVV